MLIDKLTYILQEKELPGKSAQLAFTSQMTRSQEDLGKLLEKSTDAVPAATLCILFPSKELGGQLSFVLIERTSTVPDDPHSGQISFPGGKKEKVDSAMVDTAIRESEEEVGIIGKDVQILGKLSDLFISVSNHNVSPFVGYMDYTPHFIPQVSEVKQVLTPSLHALLNPDNILYTDINVRNTTLKNMPYFNLKGKVVWGATAMILSEFRVVVQRALEL